MFALLVGARVHQEPIAHPTGRLTRRTIPPSSTPDPKPPNPARVLAKAPIREGAPRRNLTLRRHLIQRSVSITSGHGIFVSKSNRQTDINALTGIGAFTRNALRKIVP